MFEGDISMRTKNLRVLFSALLSSLIFLMNESAFANPFFNPGLYHPDETQVNQELTEDQLNVILTYLDFAKTPSSRTVNQCEDPLLGKRSRPALRTVSQDFANKIIRKVQFNSPEVEDSGEVDGNLQEMWIASTGRSRETRIKKMDYDAYDGPKTEDFLERLQVIQDAALDQVGQVFSGSLRSSRSKEIIALTKEFRRRLISEASIHWEVAQANLKNNNNQYILGKIEKARAIINLYVVALAPLVPSSSGQPLGLKKLKKLEDEYTKKIGRENIVNIYRTEKDGPQYVSIHRPIKRIGEVQPSAIRDRAGLANALETSFHVISKSGQPVVLFSAYRHSSYTPLKIKDKYDRKLVVIENFKDLIGKMTRNYKNSNHGECPKFIHLSTMSLFTPVKGDKFIRGSESEVRQLEDVYFVTRMFDGHEISVEGCNVTPKTTYMNIGANQFDVKINGSTLGKFLLGSSEEEGANAKGYSDFEDDVHDFLQSNLKEIKEVLSKGKFSRSETSRLEDVLRSLNRLRVRYLMIEESVSSLKKKAVKLKDDLRVKYKALELLSSDRDQFLKMTKEIEKQEKDLKKLYLEVSQSYKKIYEEQGESLRAIENDVASEISTIAKDLKMKDQPEMIRAIGLLKKHKDIIQLYSDNKKLYWSQKIYTSEHKTDFQRNYLIAHYLMGHDIDFFCKSAEDRTGLVNNKIEEAMIFRAQHGRYPRFDQARDQKRLNQIAFQVYHGGASRDTTGRNNRGARGLQINVKGQYQSQGKTESAMGVLAKKVYLPTGGGIQGLKNRKKIHKALSEP